MYKEKIYEYVTYLGESMLKVIKNQLKLGKMNFMLFEHDKTMSKILLDLQENINNNTQISDVLVKEYRNMLDYMLILSNKVDKLNIDHEETANTLAESALIIRKILQAGS
jgi:hypothetical protein